MYLDFPGGPVVRTPRFHCRGRRFDPWSGNWDPACHTLHSKKKKKGLCTFWATPTMLSAIDSKLTLAVLSQLLSFLDNSGSGWHLSIIQLKCLTERRGHGRWSFLWLPKALASSVAALVHTLSCLVPGFLYLWPWLPFPILPQLSL